MTQLIINNQWIEHLFLYTICRVHRQACVIFWKKVEKSKTNFWTFEIGVSMVAFIVLNEKSVN